MVEKVKFIQIDVDYKTYNRIVRVTTRNDGGTSDLIVEKKVYLERLWEKNEFLRLRCGEHYADLNIKSWLMEGQTIVIHFGNLIDYSKAVIFPSQAKEFVKKSAPKTIRPIVKEIIVTEPVQLQLNLKFRAIKPRETFRAKSRRIASKFYNQLKIIFEF